MSIPPWTAGPEVVTILEEVRAKNHNKRLENAKVALCFNDSKPFIKERFNWGKASKFSSLAKLWHAKDKKYDFQILLPADGWYQVLQGEQREAWLDLHLCRFRPEMIPATVEENGKKKVIKDKFGRIEYTDEIRLDEQTGEPIWKVDPLDLHVFAENAKRYGVWCECLQEFKEALGHEKVHKGKITANAECSFKANVEPDEEEVPYEYLKKIGVGMD